MNELKLEDLEVVATTTTEPEPEAKPKRRTAAQRKADEDWQRSMAVRNAFLRLGLDSTCRNFTLEEIVERWHQVRGSK